MGVVVLARRSLFFLFFTSSCLLCLLGVVSAAVDAAVTVAREGSLVPHPRRAAKNGNGTTQQASLKIGWMIGWYSCFA